MPARVVAPISTARVTPPIKATLSARGRSNSVLRRVLNLLRRAVLRGLAIGKVLRQCLLCMLLPTDLAVRRLHRLHHCVNAGSGSLPVSLP